MRRMAIQRLWVAGFAMNYQPILEDYLKLMETIKIRQALVSDLTQNFHGLPPFCIAETIHLQIRLICETLALACLVAHGDVQGSRSARLSSAYQADFIMNTLEKLHPTFYPRPTTQIIENGKVVRWEDIEQGYLTKSELIKAYRDAADHLHVGPISELSPNKPKVLDLIAITAWFGKLTRLLTHHNIYLADLPPEPGETSLAQLFFADGTPCPRRQLIVLMSTKDHGGAASAHIFGIADPTERHA
jgi:hypothetical protein